MSRVLKNGEYRITQGYSIKHQAVDLVKAPSSLETIIAHSGGKVVFCQTGHKNNKGSSGNASYGNCVRIEHGNGYSTLYAHLDKVYVKLGDFVTEGQEIGYMGNSGNSYGGHLHFEVRKDGKKINPTAYLDADLPLTPSVIYAVHTNKGRWLSDIVDYNEANGSGYAGIIGKTIDGIRAKLSKGSIVYRVHTVGGKYLPWVKDLDATEGGYAGIYGRNIDGIQMKLEGLDGYAVEYRVSPKGKNYLSWVRNCNDGAANGYAGIYGQAIDRIQIRIVKV